jgi:kumamolisin
MSVSRLGARLLAVAFAVILGLAVQPSEITTRAATPPASESADSLSMTVPLPGSQVPSLAAAGRLSSLDSNRPLAVALSLKVRNEPALQRFIADVYDPTSPLYHRFLTSAQFAARFAPPSADREKLKRWLQHHSLRIVEELGNGLQLTAVGRVKEIEAAFGVQLYNYRRGAQRFFGNASAVRLPRYLAREVVAVSGLSNSEPVQSHIPLARLRGRSALQPGLTPQNLASLYNLQPLYRQGITGSRNSIAVAEFADYNPDDIATYDGQYGVSGSVERVSVHTAVGDGAPLGDGQDETELDIEMVQAVAPDAHVIVYEAPNGRVGMLSLWNQIVSDNRAQVISSSWGEAEITVSSATMHALNQTFEEAAAQGQSVFVASGDAGAYDGLRDLQLGHLSGRSSAHKAKRKLIVDFPASDPWVTAVGGTTLIQHADGSYDHEIAWSNPADSSGPVGSGGGLSKTFRRPSYQVGPGVANRYSNGMRQIPDVAADADPKTGYSIYTLDQGTPKWQTVGGTSASTPVWASFALLLDQALEQRVGFLNPTLYALGQRASSLAQSPFHDVVEGTNLYYPATPGWDFATGWGSFDAAALLSDLPAIGGIVKARLPTVDFSLEVEVDLLDHGQFVGVYQVRRGQTVYLLTYVTITRMAADGAAQRRLTLAMKSHILYRRTVVDHFQTSDLSRAVTRSLRFQIPRAAARGTYTLTVQQTMQGTTEQATTQVHIR